MNYQTQNYDEKTRLITTILDLVDELKEFDDFQEPSACFAKTFQDWNAYANRFLM